MTNLQLQAKSSMDTVVTLLESVITKLKSNAFGIIHIQSDGRLDDGDQYAVRVLESRLRFMRRLWEVVMCKDQYKLKELYKLVQVSKRDVGKLFVIGDVKHSLANIDCRACDRVDSPEGPESGARICPTCQIGIQHLHTTRVDITGVKPMGVHVPEGDPLKVQPITRQIGTTRIYKVIQGFKCDSCGDYQQESERTETLPVPLTEGKGKIITMRLV